MLSLQPIYLYFVPSLFGQLSFLFKFVRLQKKALPLSLIIFLLHTRRSISHCQHRQYLIFFCNLRNRRHATRLCPFKWVPFPISSVFPPHILWGFSTWEPLFRTLNVFPSEISMCKCPNLIFRNMVVTSHQDIVALRIFLVGVTHFVHNDIDIDLSWRSVDPHKPSGQNLYRLYTSKKAKIVLNAVWVHKCIKANQLQTFHVN